MANNRNLFLEINLVLIISGSIKCIGLGNCPRHGYIEDFDIAKFSGAWYEVERSFYLMELLSTCTKINLEQMNQRQTAVNVTTFNRWSGAINNVEGIATVSRKDPSVFLHKRISSLPNALIKWLPGFGFYQVLSTDYDNYAIIWTCSNALLGVGYSDLVWIFARHWDLDATSRVKIYEILKFKHIDPDRFTLTNRNCSSILNS